jgi:transposase
MSEEPHVPTIILKLTDPLTFNLECDIEMDKLHLMRAMLTEALETVRTLIQDAEAVQFAAKMSAAQAAQRAMQKAPRRII